MNFGAMDQSKDFVSSMAQNFKPTRRRFKKTDTDPGTNLFKRNSQGSGTSNPFAWRKLSAPSQQTRTPSQLTLPMLSDLNDSKWLEYLEQTGALGSDDRLASSRPRDTITGCSQSVSDLSHLTLDDAPGRPSLDSSSGGSPRSSTSTISTMRRRAKTPVFTIEQSDNSSVKRRRWRAASSDDKTGVELIAEQYRVLLDRDVIEEEAPAARARPTISPTTSFFSNISEDEAALSGSEEFEFQQYRPQTDPEPILRADTYSPSSDDGTLVAFEEDVIYFKPVSFSPDPSPPLLQPKTYDGQQQSRDSRQTPIPAQDSLSLQICLDLLTGELSKSFARPSLPERARGDASALQVWVMIEAYEKLRNQLMHDGQLQDPERQNVAAIFDSWLASLYVVHKSLVEKAGAGAREHEGLDEAAN